MITIPVPETSPPRPTQWRYAWNPHERVTSRNLGTAIASFGGPRLRLTLIPPLETTSLGCGFFTGTQYDSLVFEACAPALKRPFAVLRHPSRVAVARCLGFYALEPFTR
jgi:hypothetical protein